VRGGPVSGAVFAERGDFPTCQEAGPNLDFPSQIGFDLDFAFLHPPSSFSIAISQFTSFGSLPKHAETGPESFGIVVFRFVGTVPDLLGLA
jgi:hypothetical protein